MPAAGTMYLTTSTGYPYTYHNGVAYFHTPEVTSVPPPWPVSNFILTGFLSFIQVLLLNFLKQFVLFLKYSNHRQIQIIPTYLLSKFNRCQYFPISIFVLLRGGVKMTNSGNVSLPPFPCLSFLLKSNQNFVHFTCFYHRCVCP